MKKILFLTTYAAPYRVVFFDELAKQAQVTVLFSDRKENQTHRSKAWFVEGEGRFRGVQLEKRVFSRNGKHLCLDVLDWLKQPWDEIVLCGYSCPTVMLSMLYLRLRRIPFWMEVDGGLIRQDSGLKLWYKKLLVGSASGWISSGRATTDYLVHYGARREAVKEYPFSSLREADILTHVPTAEEKAAIRRELGLEEGKIILSIGQFIHRKGFDVLLKAAAQLPDDAKIHIVGGEPTQEYLDMCRDLGLKNICFDGFMPKQKLLRYYTAADLFVLPTREDIWGLVINEAMAYGLPVITTDRCVAGLDLVEEGVNGYIVPVGDADALADRIKKTLDTDRTPMGQVSLDKIRPYTIENMARVHMEIFEGR